MKRLIAVVAAPLLLGGCLPLPVTLASTAISGLSYLTTGKSSTDHVLSGAVEQDCALARPIIGDPVCRDIDPNSPAAKERVVVAAYPGDRDNGDFNTLHDPRLRKGSMQLDEIPQGPAQIAIALPFASPPLAPIETPGLVIEGEVEAPLPQARPIAVAAPARAWTPPKPVNRLEITAMTAPDAAKAEFLTGAASRYVVIGSLRDAGRAEVLRERYASLNAEVRSVRIDGRDWNRVVVGPFAPEQARSVKAELGEVDGKQPWIVRMQARVEQIAMR